MITTKTLKFLSSLARHNDRAWFLEHKDEYEAARVEFEEAIAVLIHGISTFDSSVEGVDAKKCIFRIYRDVRFSKDKSPYKTHFGAHIGPRLGGHREGSSGKSPERASYYIHLEPGASMIAGGAYMPSPEWLAAIRRSIDRNGKALDKILSAASFKKNFGTMEGEALKTTPKGYKSDHPRIELLKHKSFIAVRRLKDAEVLAPDFLKQAAAAFKALKPFDDFLNEALGTGVTLAFPPE